MKRILVSLLLSGAVLATTIYATNAFFSDVETSAGNSFTAGKLDLKVDFQGYYNKLVDGTPNAGNWTLTDLTTQKFFNFTDIKPGDYGEGTISLHLYDNPAWACMKINNISNGGQLAQNTTFMVWADKCNVNATPGDNIYQANCDSVITSGGLPVLSDTWALADSTSNVFTGTGALNATDTYYVGVSWGVPTTAGNDMQGDTYQADISFYTEQERHNPNFRCIPLPTPTQI